VSTTATRLSTLEAAIDRLAAAKRPRVSALLREARQRTIARMPALVAVLDVAEFERQAVGRGLSADLARARLRVLRHPMPDALTPSPGARQDEPDMAGEPSTAPVGPWSAKPS
jgi:hypothetical protein